MRERLSENQGKLEQLRIDTSVVGQINVISDGDLPNAPVKDKRRMMAVGGAAGGAIGGFLLVAALGTLDRRLTRPRDLGGLLAPGTPLFALPHLRPGRRGADPRVAAAAVLRMRAGLLTVADGEAPRVIAVVSIRPADGASETARSLAAGMSGCGLRTALLDFAGGGDPGPGGGDLRVIPARPAGRRGGWSPAAVRDLFEKAATEFDMVVADVGALRRSSDVLLIAAQAEAAVVVVRSGADSGEVAAALELLERGGAAAAAAVFNLSPVGDRIDREAAEALPPPDPAVPVPAGFAALSAAVARVVRVEASAPQNEAAAPSE